MKTLYQFIPVAFLMIGAGCQSNKPHTVSGVSTTTQTVQSAEPQPSASASLEQDEPKGIPLHRFTTGNATYTIESIPNTRLTPTSREGDKGNYVYSSNIIAVYVHTNNGVTMDLTNSPVVPAPANASQPQVK